MLPGRKLVYHHAQGENVAAGIERFAPRLFRRHIGNGAYRRARAGKQVVAKWARQGGVSVVSAPVTRIALFDLGQAEVQDLDLAAGRQEDVGRLDVAMKDAFAMGRIQRIGCLHSQVQQLGVGHGAMVVELVQALSLPAAPSR